MSFHALTYVPQRLPERKEEDRSLHERVLVPAIEDVCRLGDIQAVDAPSPINPGATNGYWRSTRNAVLQGKRTGRPGAGLVEELDPDAINRDGNSGKGLTPDDAVSTTRLNNRPPFLQRAVYTYGSANH